MRIHRVLFIFVAAALGAFVTYGADQKAAAATREWAANVSIIEACSCPMFCQCYFNGEPAAHSEHATQHEGHGGATHFCKFNNAYKINSGHYGDTKLDGATFWIAGDLGGDFSKGQTEWAVITFDPTVSKAQREGIKTIMGHVYPVEWKSFSVADDAKVDWRAGKDSATALLGGGKLGEVQLAKFPGMTDEPVTIHNLRYFGAPRNSGFIMMPNKVEAYRTGDKQFEYNGTNGFMITLDISSKDVAAAQKMAAK